MKPSEEQDLVHPVWSQAPGTKTPVLEADIVASSAGLAHREQFSAIR
jgi:hypothetical protein